MWQQGTGIVDCAFREARLRRTEDVAMERASGNNFQTGGKKKSQEVGISLFYWKAKKTGHYDPDRM